SLGAHTWLWDFGDGDTSHAQNPVHVYDSSGTYTISLTVKYLPTGCTDSRSIPVTVSDPQANFTVSDSFGCRPLPVDFTNLSKDAVSWQWQSAGLTTQVKNPSFTYRDPGVYDVQLIVTDVNGCKDTLKVDDLITVIGPDAEFGVSTTTGCAPLAVSFQDSSTAFMGNIVSWKWYFGDGDSSSLQNPSHFYDQPGSYDVTLTVTDDNGCSHTLTKNNFVQPTYPAPDFTANQESCSGAPVTFTNLTTGVGLSFLWDFGDGNTSTDPNPVHQYAQPGVYTVTLTATDINGCDSTIVKPDYITISDPVANFTATPTFSPCPPLLAQFHDSSTSDVVSWLWDFGDGFTSTDSMPSHLYVEPGTFTVTLIVTSRWGCKDTIVAPDLAVILGPNGTYTFTPNKGCIDHEVTFTAVTTNTALRTWYFGDGYSQIGGDTITHTYTTTGIFHPVLVMDDGMGCQFARAANDSVIVGKLNIDFNASNTYSCTPGTVDFTAIIQSTPNAVGNLWDFGDGTTSSAANPSHFYTTPGVYDVTLY
ncbi:MAG: PKD domain-containing protein, partial [Chloroflexi bacterium]